MVTRGSTRGKWFLTTRWVMQQRDQGVRARFVCREFRKLNPGRDDIFAPASSVITSRVIDAVANHRRCSRFTFDASNAFFHAKETEEVYAEPPVEWREEM